VPDRERITSLLRLVVAACVAVTAIALQPQPPHERVPAAAARAPAAACPFALSLSKGSVAATRTVRAEVAKPPADEVGRRTACRITRRHGSQGGPVFALRAPAPRSRSG